MRLFSALLALTAAIAAPSPAHAGAVAAEDIAIYKGLIVTMVKKKNESGVLKTHVEKSHAYAVIALPDGLKQAKVALLLPVKVGGEKLLRISPPPAFNLSPTGFIQAITEPVDQGAFILCGASDYFGGYTGITLRGNIKDGLKAILGANQNLPRTLLVAERYARRHEEGHGFYERNGSVKIDTALSTEANTAGDDFNAAVERVKARFPSHTAAFAL